MFELVAVNSELGALVEDISEGSMIGMLSIPDTPLMNDMGKELIVGILSVVESPLMI